MTKTTTTRSLALALAVSFAPGCYKTTTTVGSGSPSEGEATIKHWENHFIAGLIGKRETDVAQVCSSGNATIKRKHSFVNGLIAQLTFFIYTPTTIEIWCANDSSTAIELDAEQTRAVALAPETLEYLHATDPAEAARLEAALAMHDTAASR